MEEKTLCLLRIQQRLFLTTNLKQNNLPLRFPYLAAKVYIQVT